MLEGGGKADSGRLAWEKSQSGIVEFLRSLRSDPTAAKNSRTGAGQADSLRRCIEADVASVARAGSRNCWYCMIVRVRGGRRGIGGIETEWKMIEMLSTVKRDG